MNVKRTGTHQESTTRSDDKGASMRTVERAECSKSEGATPDNPSKMLMRWDEETIQSDFQKKLNDCHDNKRFKETYRREQEQETVKELWMGTKKLVLTTVDTTR